MQRYQRFCKTDGGSRICKIAHVGFVKLIKDFEEK